MTNGSSPRRATIVHGYGATPRDHWFDALAADLDAAGFTTAIPALPDTLTPDPARWQAAVADAAGVPDENAVIVAHSLGALTVLRHLAALDGPWRLGALVLVAGFVDRLPGLPELDAYIGDGADVTGIAGHVDRVTVLRSDADAIVPAGHTDRLAGLLGVASQVVPGAGHFLGDEGVTRLPEAFAAARPS
ncbi:RBBP9/YdeN family alpha/beta hydrolase [Actinomadura flavalba]|uniref:RBBP9/YdeN family alpha/beta hydrolase n=1 Tax=Actinomadura flavalba TaxID=1120938 RepID=UPI00036B0BE2|nr:alpha/beta hydrolase [Actinomadura flavalba]